MLDETTKRIFNIDAALEEAWAEIERLRREEQRAQELIDERQSICDLLSAQPETKAGQTLVEALQSVLAELAAAQALIAGMRRSLKKEEDNENM